MYIFISDCRQLYGLFLIYRRKWAKHFIPVPSLPLPLYRFKKYAETFNNENVSATFRIYTIKTKTLLIWKYKSIIYKVKYQQNSYDANYCTLTILFFKKNKASDKSNILVPSLHNNIYLKICFRKRLWYLLMIFMVTVIVKKRFLTSLWIYVWVLASSCQIFQFRNPTES